MSEGVDFFLKAMHASLLQLVAPGQCFRLLCGMRMLDAGVDFQFRELSGAQSGMGKHSFNCTLDNCRRTSFSQGLQGFLFEAMREA